MALIVSKRTLFFIEIIEIRPKNAFISMCSRHQFNKEMNCLEPARTRLEIAMVPNVLSVSSFVLVILFLLCFPNYFTLQTVEIPAQSL